MRDIVQLEIEEDFESAVLEGPHDGGTLGVEERHPHFEPRGVPGEKVGELEGAVAVAVKRDHDAVARGSL